MPRPPRLPGSKLRSRSWLRRSNSSRSGGRGPGGCGPDPHGPRDPEPQGPPPPGWLLHGIKFLLAPAPAGLTFPGVIGERVRLLQRALMWPVADVGSAHTARVMTMVNRLRHRHPAMLHGRDFLPRRIDRGKVGIAIGREMDMRDREPPRQGHDLGVNFGAAGDDDARRPAAQRVALRDGERGLDAWSDDNTPRCGEGAVAATTMMVRPGSGLPIER